MSLLQRLLLVCALWGSGSFAKQRRWALRFQFGIGLLFPLTLAWMVNVSSSMASEACLRQQSLALINRTVTQDQAAWVIDYWLRHTGKTGMIVTPEEVAVNVEGWVSNSRVASHALPRWSSLVITQSAELSTISDVISADDEGHKCRERLVVSLWTQDQPDDPYEFVDRALISKKARDVSSPRQTSTPEAHLLSIGPGSIVRVQLRLEHQHILYGEYNVLLANRMVRLSLGPATVRDIVPLDHEQYLTHPRFAWGEPPDERRDPRHSVSGPDSLHLEAHIPGHQYYQYPERPVRYSTKMRLQFYYLIAAGTEGDCKVKVGQAKNTPVSWRQLTRGSFEQCLKTVGRWTKVEHVFQTDPEATDLTLEFKIVGDTEVGEMWIDNVTLEPVGYSEPGGP